MADRYDAIVIGSGPNGLAAAITLARAGLQVLVREAQLAIGGGARSAELTLPGFVHDICSAVHPLAVASPFFRQLSLAAHGLDWIEPPAAVAHPLEDGSAVVVERSIEVTAAQLGPDANAYHHCMTRLAADWDNIASAILGPPSFPSHPLAFAHFARWALTPAYKLARKLFRGERAQALFAGMAAHSMLPLEKMPSAAFGLVLGTLAHVVGWPLPRCGAQSISNALASYLRSLGGEIVTSAPVRTIDELLPARAILCDVTPRQLIAIAGHRLTPRFLHRFAKYRYGPAAYKVDWALDRPIPWKAPECLRAATIHLGGTLEEIAASERTVWQGEHTEKPIVLLAQPSLFDATRTPQGMHTAWAYCHVPHRSGDDMTEQIESQVERFAPGFRRHILARSVIPPVKLEGHNANLVGGDINGGVQDLAQILFRPTRHLYSTGAKGIYVCSASTPPGGGVHGMCGYHAARKALKIL